MTVFFRFYSQFEHVQNATLMPSDTLKTNVPFNLNISQQSQTEQCRLWKVTFGQGIIP